MLGKWQNWKKKKKMVQFYPETNIIDQVLIKTKLSGMFSWNKHLLYIILLN